jgi:predicted nuclease of predicted toxin-antitoxin system
MAQTKIILDSNSYFRLAQNIHPLLCEPFGKSQFTLYIHSELGTEFKRSARLKNKFHWFTEPRFVANRIRSISLSAENKKKIESTYEYLWEHVQDEFLTPHGKGPSPIDTRIVAIALVLNIPLVTDDRDMIELASVFDAKHITSLGLMKLMLDERRIDDAKVDQMVEQWVYDNDTPYSGWREEFKSVFSREAPKGY